MGCSQAEHQPCSWRVLKSMAPFPWLIHSLVVAPLLQQALQALQEEQARLKIRLQELRVLQRNLRDCPQDKVNFEGVWPGRESRGSLNFTPGPATSLLCDLIHLLTPLLPPALVSGLIPGTQHQLHIIRGASLLEGSGGLSPTLKSASPSPPPPAGPIPCARVPSGVPRTLSGGQGNGQVCGFPCADLLPSAWRLRSGDL